MRKRKKKTERKRGYLEDKHNEEANYFEKLDQLQKKSKKIIRSRDEKKKR